ncbi:MAG TPA: urea ABC transporter ATP-binding protein UrtD [Bryobacterales bacterium]|nr:urea ABC transporter ATP-binding protein UrtD [Bryobacterales bacterium]
MADTIIYLEGVTVSFEGFKALNNLNFIVDRGELRVVIGPNGAGKTTLLDVICGRVRPAEGRVIFGEMTNIVSLGEHEIARLGIGRKFQTPSVFKNLTVYENFELACRQKSKGVFATLFASPSPSMKERIEAVLETTGLTGKAWQMAGSLSHGEKQWLEIGMVIMQDPQLMLIDEPVAGMTGQETEKTGELLKSIAGERSLLVIEHDMVFVRQIARKVTVLHEGAVLCEGPMEKVQSDPRVVEIYLGRESKEHGGH